MTNNKDTRKILNRLLDRVEKKDWLSKKPWTIEETVTQIVYSELVDLVGIDEARKDRGK